MTDFDRRRPAQTQPEPDLQTAEPMFDRPTPALAQPDSLATGGPRPTSPAPRFRYRAASDMNGQTEGPEAIPAITNQMTDIQATEALVAPGTTEAGAAAVPTVASLSTQLVAASFHSAAELPYARTAIPGILNESISRALRDPDQVAYVLATAHHESSYGLPKYSRSESLVEDHNPLKHDAKGDYRISHITGHRIAGADLDPYYDDGYGGILGNTKGTGDAADFRGRGYVQLTGRSNYQDWTERLKAENYSYTYAGVTYGGNDGQPLDLTKHPEHVNKVPQLAARILVEGMEKGTFTGEKLSDDINDKTTDFYGARDIVNGDKRTNGKKIAGYAEGYAKILKAEGAWTKLLAAQG